MPVTCCAQSKGEIEIDIVDAKSKTPLECRVQLRGPNGNSIKPKSIDTLGPWNLVNGLSFRGRPGEYQYEIFHGMPEYSPARGRFILDKKSEAFDAIELPRHADMLSENWLGGDLLCYLPKSRSSLWLTAESLFFAASVSESQNASGQIDSASEVQMTSFLDNRPGSGLLIHHWSPSSQIDESIDLLKATTPSSKLIVSAKNFDNQDRDFPVHVEVQKLWARDLPVWLASGRIDSVQLLSDHLTYDGKGAAEVRPLVMPEGKFQGGRAGGRIVEQIYWQMLEAGLRIPPTAGSGSGKGASPLGYNRVYGLVASKKAEDFWQAIRAGNSFVTNGPLLRVSINGMPPGQVFKSDQAIELDTRATVTVGDPVEYLEVVHNYQTLYRAPLDEVAKVQGKLPDFKIDQSGWLIIRVVTGRDFSYRMATTAPFYFEIQGEPRIKSKSVEFFLQWLAATRREIAKLPVEAQREHEPFLQSAEHFWQARRAQATD